MGSEVRDVVEYIHSVATEHFALCAIATVPNNVESAKTPLVIIPNSGLVHHVGACRFSVQLARFLAEHGILVCRVDLPNLGDSGPRFDGHNLTDEQRTVEELQAIITDMHQEYGERPVVVYGLCSGSQNGFKLAVQDPRVVGLFGVDHFGFRNWSYKAVHYARRAFRIEPWANLIRRLLAKSAKPNKTLGKEGNEGNEDLGGGNFVWQYPSKQSVEQGYTALVQRGVKMHYLYTGDWSGEYNHRQQFFLMHKDVDFKNQVAIDYRPEMSHILAEPISQAFVRSRVLQFIQSLARASSL